MNRILKDGLAGLGVGIAGGIMAGILLAPKGRLSSGRQSLSADVADAVVDAAQIGMDAMYAIRRLSGSSSGKGMLPDERLTLQIREQLEGLALWGPRLDVTTIDGKVYVRGREANAQRADAIVHTIEGFEGVTEIVDELRRT